MQKRGLARARGTKDDSETARVKGGGDVREGLDDLSRAGAIDGGEVNGLESGPVGPGAQWITLLNG